MEQKNHRNNRENEEPRIYVASLEDYRDGRLHGRWICAAQPGDALRSEIDETLAESDHPGDWFIRNHDNFGRLRIREREDLDELSDAATFIAEYGPLATMLLHHLGGIAHASEARSRIERGLRRDARERSTFLENLLDECAAYFRASEEKTLARSFLPVAKRSLLRAGRDVITRGRSRHARRR